MDTKEAAAEEKRRGRPLKHQGGARARTRAWRDRQKSQGRRLDGYVGDSAAWRLKRLAAAWGCSLAGAVERLALEADDRYESILFPETE
ncbi:MAG: hypothetical protein U5J62_06370 [Desulfurivibrio sp.]|nr:hypothetical protein [Desulfurivibrio sp.]